MKPYLVATIFIACSLPSQTSLQDRLIKSMDARIATCEELVSVGAAEIKTAQELFNAGRLSALRLEDTQAATWEAQMRLAGLHIEKIRMQDDFASTAAPSFAALRGHLESRRALCKKRVEQATRSHAEVAALYSAGRTPLEATAQAERTVIKARLALQRADHAILTLELEEVKWKKAQGQKRGGQGKD